MIISFLKHERNFMFFGYGLFVVCIIAGFFQWFFLMLGLLTIIGVTLNRNTQKEYLEKNPLCLAWAKIYNQSFQGKEVDLIYIARQLVYDPNFSKDSIGTKLFGQCIHNMRNDIPTNFPEEIKVQINQIGGMV